MRFVDSQPVRKMSRIITAIVLLASLVSQRSARADDIATPDASGNKPVAVRVDIRAQYALTHPGDPNQGRLLFQDQERTRCMVCHQLGRYGGNVGPALNGIGGKFDRPHLIESLLEPSREIVEGYNVTNLALKDGRVLSGIVKQESRVDLMLVDAQAEWHRVQLTDIEERVVSKVSLMPEGLIKNLTKEEFTDLIAYLESQRYGGGSPGANLAGAYSFPEGFTVSTVATGITAAATFEVLPDGRVLICEQNGFVRVAKDGRLLPEPALEVDVERNRERGLLGVTIDPNFPEKPYVYLCRVRQYPYTHHVVSRWTMKGDKIDPNSEVVLLEGDNQGRIGGSDPASAQGGALHFGPDGCLYISLGEQTAAPHARSINSLLGKILRINPDGSIPKDNPFYEQTTDKYRSIWAKGLRNPYSFAIRPGTNSLYVTDVGGRFEELNVVNVGDDMGWPSYDHGPTSTAFVSPIHYYQRSCICGAAFSTPSWPEPYRNKFFFADFTQGWIRMLDPDKPEDYSTFGEGLRRPVDLRFGADGRMYILVRNAWVLDRWTTQGTGSLVSVQYTGTARDKVAAEPGNSAKR
ncbi:MAG: PQQ-dependent sugar dehydrogenase [Planctomycetaceae bacterium]|nr:PQQ-dependent sugar dehydrogenase [Planctomycetaceae bacterium]